MRTRAALFVALVVALVAACSSATEPAKQPPQTFDRPVALTDLGANFYLQYTGGLYANGSHVFLQPAFTNAGS